MSAKRTRFSHRSRTCTKRWTKTATVRRWWIRASIPCARLSIGVRGSRSTSRRRQRRMVGARHERASERASERGRRRRRRRRRGRVVAPRVVRRRIAETGDSLKRRDAARVRAARPSQPMRSLCFERAARRKKTTAARAARDDAPPESLHRRTIGGASTSAHNMANDSNHFVL